jgi:hypothetical protein
MLEKLFGYQLSRVTTESTKRHRDGLSGDSSLISNSISVDDVPPIKRLSDGYRYNFFSEEPSMIKTTRNNDTTMSPSNDSKNYSNYLLLNNYDFVLTEHSLSDEEEIVSKKSRDQNLSVLEIPKKADLESRAQGTAKKMSLDIKNFEIIGNRVAENSPVKKFSADCGEMIKGDSSSRRNFEFKKSFGQRGSSDGNLYPKDFEDIKKFMFDEDLIFDASKTQERPQPQSHL